MIDPESDVGLGVPRTGLREDYRSGEKYDNQEKSQVPAHQRPPLRAASYSDWDCGGPAEPYRSS